VAVRVERPEIVAAAGELATVVAESADEIEARGRLPELIVDHLTDAGLYALYRPAAMGGPQVDPISAFMAIEHLAQADGSVAWCAHVSSGNSYQLATLSPDVVAAMGHPPHAARRFAGSNRPLGRARRVEGGYLVDGRWDFASNCLQADWYCAACVDEEGGRHRVRGLFIPMADCEVLDTWRVAGLRGTGSHDVVVRGVFVPDEHVASGRNLSVAAEAGTLYTQRLALIVNWILTAAVALGIAKGALDAFRQLSDQGTAHGVDSPLRERAEVQGAIGRATAVLGAARSYCLHACADVWEAAGGLNPLDHLVLESRLAITHAMRAAVDVVDVLFHAAGTRSIYNHQGIERRFRDAHVAAQHFAGSPSHLSAGGRLVLGLPAGAPYW
jgi:alkylation response protein AidB-like acyl-CoA dehydrogenase